jgi:5,10-methylenetetrahydromethanopterin reductase
VNSTPRFGLGISNCRGSADVVAGVSLAEELGAEVAFVAEDIGCRDAFALLSQCARETSRVHLSTGVVNPFTRNPMSLAMAVATVHEISGGRASLGLGSGSPSLMEGAMGLPHVRPVQVMREATEVVRALLSGERVSYSGEIFRYVDAHLDFAPPPPQIPVVYAAMGPRMLHLAGAMADGVLLNVGAAPQYVRWAVSEIAAGAREAGRDPSDITVAAWLTAYVVDDRAAGLGRAKRWLATMLSIPRQGELLLEGAGFPTDILAPIRAVVSGYPHSGDPDAAAAHIPDEIADRLTLVGTPHRILERIEEYRDAGVDIPVLGLAPLREVMRSA